MSDQLRIGQMLYGFCCGAFGRDSYDDKRVEAIGADWVVCRTSRGHVAVYEGKPEYLLEFIYPSAGSATTKAPVRLAGPSTSLVPCAPGATVSTRSEVNHEGM